jgi:hypothetical protein
MQTTHRSRKMKIGLATVASGLFLAVVGLSVSPAEAVPRSNKVTICHRTNSTSNPYRIISISFNAANGELQGPDHTGHTGPVFDYSADPSDPDYPYNPPMNGDEWGDIIPPYAWVGGSYPGSANWTEGGLEIWAEGCNGATEICWDESEPVNGQCPVLPPDACPALAGFQTDPAECPPPVDVCPTVDGLQTDVSQCPALVSSTTITPPVQVAGIQVLPAVVTPAPVVVAAASAPTTLPRTGTKLLPLAELGFGLMLLGAGALLFAREQAATA